MLVTPMALVPTGMFTVRRSEVTMNIHIKMGCECTSSCNSLDHLSRVLKMLLVVETPAAATFLKADLQQS
jgi:hypothetical protein